MKQNIDHDDLVRLSKLSDVEFDAKIKSYSDDPLVVFLKKANSMVQLEGWDGISNGGGSGCIDGVGFAIAGSGYASDLNPITL